MMKAAAEIAAQLEALAARDASPQEYSESLRVVNAPGLLLAVAEYCMPNTSISEALYRRGLELGASEETLRGYLALANIFEGRLEKASELVLTRAGESRDDVVLSAWANLDTEPGEVTRRLVEAIGRCPESLRLRRQLADYSLRIRRMDLAQVSHRWLLINETSGSERERVAAVIREQDW
jgi:hypothetical protein